MYKVRRFIFTLIYLLIIIPTAFAASVMAGLMQLLIDKLHDIDPSWDPVRPLASQPPMIDNVPPPSIADTYDHENFEGVHPRELGDDVRP